MEFEGIKQSLIAPPQCYTPSMLPPPSPQIRHIYRAGPDNSVASLTLDDLSDFTEDQHQFQYTQQSGVFESHFKSDQGESQFGSSTNTSSSSPSPSAYGSNLTSYRSNDSLPVSNPSTAEPLSTTQTMSANLKAPLLHVAIRTRKKSVVRLLLRRGASTVDERDALGRTALHIAAQCGDEEMVRTILQHGADPKILDREGLDALRLAVEHARCEVIEILLDAIAQREELNGMPALV
jgi:ankyrin repeat protein